jgi:SAM-dependent methyltransferase
VEGLRLSPACSAGLLQRIPGNECAAIATTGNSKYDSLQIKAAKPIDLDIVLERLDLAAADRFDLIVGTNVFVYFDAFEQALALENAGAMLKPGGLLLTNDRLPELHSGSMRLAGIALVSPNAPGVNSHEGVGWYRKQ